MASHIQQNTSQFEFQLLNNFQRAFPLCARPFQVLAEQLQSDEDTVIASLQDLQKRGLVSRVGAVFQPNVVGASALAALAVPAARLAAVAALINARSEINHNYEREHHYNCWFVASAASAADLQTALQEIETECECGTMLVLPMLEDFHIDLGFDLQASTQPQYERTAVQAPQLALPGPAALSASDKILLAALQHGLPLQRQPYAALGLSEADALATLADWSASGVIKRFGVIVRHHELGFTANAMLVWDVPDNLVSAMGRRIAASGQVTLCYRRMRQLPHWPYNLFCMLHGKDRSEVELRIAALLEACALENFPQQVLFSQRRFKQRGAHYVIGTKAAPQPKLELRSALSSETNYG